jgi:hypothetical protein
MAEAPGVGFSCAASAEVKPSPSQVRRRQLGVSGGEDPFVRRVVAELGEHLLTPLRRHGAHLGPLLMQVANGVEERVVSHGDPNAS